MSADPQDAFEDLIAALSRDADLAPFVRPGAAVLVWDASGERILWASPEAARLRAAVLGAAGTSRSAQRLRALAQGLAPAHGVRLERLRLDPGPLAASVTCACRRVMLPSGEQALLTAVTGVTGRPATRESFDPGARHAKSLSPAAATATDSRGGGERGTVRFVWRCDEHGRFTERSEVLCKVVGPASADIVGRSWSEIAGDLMLDESGGVADLIARAETWRGRRVLWRIAGTDRVVPVDLAGMPVRGPDGRLTGFRGFGLCRTDLARSPADGAPMAATVDIPDDETADEGRAEVAPARDVAAPGLAAVPGPAVGASPANQAGPSAAVLRAVPRDEPAVAASRREAAPAVQRSHRPFPRLSVAERSAFREIARALGARFEADDAAPPQGPGAEIVPVRPLQPVPAETLKTLDRLPIGILVHRGETPLFANRALLDLLGYKGVPALAGDGGLARLFRGRWPALARTDEAVAPVALATRRNGTIAVEARLTTLEWGGLPATVMLVRKLPDNDPAQRLRALELDLRAEEARLRELASILDTATDGVIVLDDGGRILSLNRSAEALFGYEQGEVIGERLTALLAPESHLAALDYLEGLRATGVAGLLNDGREVVGRVRQGGAIPLFMTMGRISESPERKFCAVLRDVTAFKKAEAELVAAKRAAEQASAHKSDFLAKISHEIRTPLNAIIGFAEVMLEERFGPIGNERYRDYLRDVHQSGRHVISLVNDLLDLAKIEAGRMELTFSGINLNDVSANCVALLLQEAARQRIVVRTSFTPKLPTVVADERSVRQIVLNIVSNAIRFTDAGGQVIVSTTVTDRGQVVFRVKDTGIGMSETEIEAALEPFRQLATARKGGGTGLGLPLTKALVEANRAALHITSTPREGTLVEVLFPSTRVLVE